MSIGSLIWCNLQTVWKVYGVILQNKLVPLQKHGDKMAVIFVNYSKKKENEIEMEAKENKEQATKT